jgi:hypothetical protein
LGYITFMEVIFAIYLVCLVVAVIVPTLPSSRRTRLALSVVSVFVIVFGYYYIERYSGRIGAGYMDYYITHSLQLLKDGRTDVLQDAYNDYLEEHHRTMPPSAGAAYRAYLLDSYIRRSERMKELEKKK